MLKLVLTNFGVHTHKEIVIENSRGCYLINGPSGTGKSTVLDAIAYSITGALKYLRKNGNEFKVVLEYDAGDIHICVVRSNRRVNVVFNERQYTGDIAQNIIDSVFGFHFNELNYIKQGDISFARKTPAKQHDILRNTSIHCETEIYKQRIKKLIQKRKSALAECQGKYNVYTQELEIHARPKFHKTFDEIEELGYDEEYLTDKKHQKKEQSAKIHLVNEKLFSLRRLTDQIKTFNSALQVKKSRLEQIYGDLDSATRVLKVEDIDEIISEDIMPIINDNQHKIKSLEYILVDAKYKENLQNNLKCEYKKATDECTTGKDFSADKELELSVTKLEFTAEKYKNLESEFSALTDKKYNLMTCKELIKAQQENVIKKYENILIELNRELEINRELLFKFDISADNCVKYIENCDKILLFKCYKKKYDENERLSHELKLSVLSNDTVNQIKANIQKFKEMREHVDRRNIYHNNFTLMKQKSDSFSKKLDQLVDIKRALLYKCPQCNTILTMSDGKLFIAFDETQYSDSGFTGNWTLESVSKEINYVKTKMREINEWFREYGEEQDYQCSSEIDSIEQLEKDLTNNEHIVHMLENPDTCSYTCNMRAALNDIEKLNMNTVPEEVVCQLINFDEKEITQIKTTITCIQYIDEKILVALNSISAARAEINKHLSIRGYSTFTDLCEQIEHCSCRLYEIISSLKHYDSVMKDVIFQISILKKCIKLKTQIDANKVNEDIEILKEEIEHRNKIISEGHEKRLQLEDARRILMNISDLRGEINMINTNMDEICEREDIEDIFMLEFAVASGEEEHEELEENIFKLDKDINYIENCISFTKMYREYERLFNLKQDSHDQMKELLRRISAGDRLNGMITRAECLAVENKVEYINSSVNMYCERFFPDDDIYITLSTSRKLKTKKDVERMRTTIDIMLNGRECNINSLSGGQQDRVVLAFFMSMYSSDFLLIDECLGSLDAHTVEIVVNALKELKSESNLILFVAHQVETGLFDGVIDIK